MRGRLLQLVIIFDIRRPNVMKGSNNFQTFLRTAQKMSSVVRPRDLDEASHLCRASGDFLVCGTKTNQIG